MTEETAARIWLIGIAFVVGAVVGGIGFEKFRDHQRDELCEVIFEGPRYDRDLAATRLGFGRVYPMSDGILLAAQYCDARRYTRWWPTE